MSCSTHQFPISTIDVSNILSLNVLKKMAKTAHQKLEEKLEEIEELEWGKRCLANLDAQCAAEKRADYLEAFAFAIYQQIALVKKTLSESKLDVFAAVWIPGQNIVEIVEQPQLRATSPVWLPNGMGQSKMKRFRAINTIVV